MSRCWADVAVVGYVAEMVCSRVQVCAPRVSTSAGQSAGGPVVVVVVVVVLEGNADEEEEEGVCCCLVAAVNEEKDVQDRQLFEFKLMVPHLHDNPSSPHPGEGRGGKEELLRLLAKRRFKNLRFAIFA